MIQGTISEILARHTVTDLKAMAETMDVPVAAKAKKQEYVDILSKKLANEERLRGAFLAAGRAEIAQLEAAIRGTVRVESEYEYLYWRELPVVFVTGAGEVVVPRETAEVYRQLCEDEEYGAARRMADILDGYLPALTNLYGVIEPARALEIIKEQTGADISEEQLRHWLKQRAQYRVGRSYFLQDNYLLSEVYYPRGTGMALDYHPLLEKQGDLSFYVPQKEELLRYADKYYIDKNQSYMEMEKFLRTELELDSKKAALFASHIQLVIRHGGMPRDIVEEMNRYDLTFFDSQQLNRFVTVMMDMYHNTRMPDKRGHTAAEAGIPAADREMIQSVFEAITSQKPLVKNKIGGKRIYPNELCPCGSGRKYKNCCGKKA